METKFCKCCGRELSLEHFKRGRYGYVSVCLDCDKKHRAEKRQARIDEQKKKELADCLIVCAGIYRFSKQVGITQMLNIYGIIQKNKFSKEEVEDKATAKWLINLNRKWEFKDGSYHHVGIDGAE